MQRWYIARAAGVIAAGAAALLATPGSARADVSLSPLISSGMVLQQNAPVRVWGRAAPGETVAVSIAGQTVRATAGPDGDWQVTLRPLKAGGPFTLKVAGNNTITVGDVLVGEVWVCSGQSNMEWNLNWLRTPEADADIKSANDPQLRMFTVPKRIAAAPQAELAGGEWQRAQPDKAGGFSAVGYYFARALRRERKVPVGMIHSSWGGTRIEAWTDRSTLAKQGVRESEFPGDPSGPGAKATRERYDRAVARWKAAGSPGDNFLDPGVAPAASGWEKENADESDWKPVAAPGSWNDEELADIDGAVWMRRTVDVPADAAGKAAVLSLGAIDDQDITFVNGVKVGATGVETPSSWEAKRRYTVPANVLKAGKNVIAVRVWDGQGGGGMTGSPAELTLTPEGGEAIRLAGEWRYKTENVRPSNPGNPPGLDNPNAASGLYNGMLHPLTRYTIRGALWYQGESNAGNPRGYRTQMPDLIANWRRVWGQGDYPFYLVQLAPFMAIAPEPRESSWAGLREAQSLTQSALPNVGTAVITDVGDVTDIHPRRKAPVGERLALLAREMTYGEKIEGHSPRYKSMATNGSAVTVTFDKVGAGLMASPTDSNGKPVPGAAQGRVVGFQLAGADGKFHFADAVLTGKNTVRVSSPQVPAPVAVRFGWADFPIVNLFSKGGLPADPFRSDKP